MEQGLFIMYPAGASPALQDSDMTMNSASHLPRSHRGHEAVCEKIFFVKYLYKAVLQFLLLCFYLLGETPNLHVPHSLVLITTDVHFPCPLTLWPVPH